MRKGDDASRSRREPGVFEERADKVQLRDTITRALIRPGSYLGWFRELLVTGVCLVCYPFGIGGATPDSGSDVLPAPSSTLDADADAVPVLLVHGFGHNRSGWTFLARHLRHGGFEQVYSLNYNPLANDLPGLAWELARRIDAVREVTGAGRVHLVGHSLGGIVIRYYIQLLGGASCVDTAITLASPHEGTLAAGFGRSPVLRQLRAGSWVIQALEETARPTPVHWVAYYSNLDALVQPASSAMLRHPALDATNVLVKDHGHLSILLAPGLGRSIVSRLAARRGPDRLDALPSPRAMLGGLRPAAPALPA
jgi:triacylglycerol lipase